MAPLLTKPVLAALVRRVATPQLPSGARAGDSDPKNVGADNPTTFVVLAIGLFVLFVLGLPLTICWCAARRRNSATQGRVSLLPTHKTHQYARLDQLTRKRRMSGLSRLARKNKHQKHHSPEYGNHAGVPNGHAAFMELLRLKRPDVPSRAHTVNPVITITEVPDGYQDMSGTTLHGSGDSDQKLEAISE